MSEFIDEIFEIKRKKNELLEIFKEIFPEWEGLPTGHRVFQLHSKIKDWIFKEQFKSQEVKE